MVRIRKDARLLTQDERAAYVEAIKQLRASTWNESNAYLAFADLHQLRNGAVHGEEIFLPWHRAFLWHFETLLQQVSGNDRITIPYWNWPEDGRLDDPTEGVLWQDSFLGGKGAFIRNETFVRNGASQKVFEITSGNFEGWTDSVADGDLLDRQLGRDGRGNLRTPDSFNKLLDISRYDEDDGFRAKLELYHNGAHIWVGRQMQDMAVSPVDPSFWSLHGFVDLVYERWTRARIALGQPLFPEDDERKPMPQATPFPNAGRAPKDSGVYEPHQLLTCADAGASYDVFGFEDGQWDSVAMLEQDRFHATRGGLVLRFRDIRKDRMFAADRRCLLEDVFADLPYDMRFGIDSMTRMHEGDICLIRGGHFALYDGLGTGPARLKSHGALSDFLGRSDPARVDSICACSNGKIYATSGGHYWRFKRVGERLECDEARIVIAKGWAGLGGGFDTGFDAVTETEDGMLMVFRDGQYCLYGSVHDMRAQHRPGPVNARWRIIETVL